MTKFRTDLKSNMDRFIVMEKIRCELPDVDLKSNMDRFIEFLIFRFVTE